MSNKHMKRCSISSGNRIKTSMRYHLKPIRMATIKTKKNRK